MNFLNSIERLKDNDLENVKLEILREKFTDSLHANTKTIKKIITDGIKITALNAIPFKANSEYK